MFISIFTAKRLLYFSLASSIWILGCEDTNIKSSNPDEILTDLGPELDAVASEDQMVSSDQMALGDQGDLSIDADLQALDEGLIDMEGRALEPLPAPAPTESIDAPPTWRWARGLIHMHSVHSHDACDGDPKPNGEPNEPCLADLRAAICRSQLDYLLLTDHPTSFADVTFEEAVLHDPELGDRLILDEEGAVVGGDLACADGHRVLVAPGSEGEIMPVMLTRKPADRGWYGQRTAEAVSALREAGAVMLHAHTEERTFEELWPIGLDGFEVYNLHANVNPRGPQLAEVLSEITALLQAGDRGPHPDLAMLAILRESPIALSIWNQFIARRRALGFAGSDIHQNVPPLLFPTRDGERLDSYRRLTTWFANYLLIKEVTLDEIRSALLNGRLAVVFRLLGEPQGLDYALYTPDGEREEMGSELDWAEGLELRFTAPVVPPETSLQVRLIRSQLRVDGAGMEEVVVETLSVSEGSIISPVTTPGAYRVEVWVTPNHLREHLGELADRFLQPMIWIYTNPIYLR